MNKKYPVSIETSVLKRGRSIYWVSFEKTEAVKENDNRKGKRQDKQYLRFGIRLKGPRGPLWVASRIIPLVTWRGPRGPLRAATRIIPLVTKQQNYL